MTRTLLALMLCMPIAAAAADDFKVTLLEQAVRDLQRQVEAQARQIDELRRQSAASGERPGPAAPAAASSTGSGLWLDASRWQSLQPGMSELQVISALGPPTSMRGANGERVLMYAMEIGSSGFLSGSVTLRDRAVVAVQKPALK
jgi:hypothetical protein